MAVVNTTYNFNQPNMNFGQALLYGAFGSLTGGMGMYSGYGMGMGGSLFSMMGMGMGGYGCGFGGYGIGGYSDSYAGMQLGNAFAGIALNCLTQAIGGGRGGSSKQTISSQIDDVECKASSYLKTLGNSTTLDNFNPSKSAKEYVDNTDLKKAEDAYGDDNKGAYKELKDAETELRKVGLSTDHEPTKSNVEEILKDECKKLNITDENKVADYIKENYDKKFDECNKKYSKYKDAKTKMDLAKQDLDAKLEKYNEQVDRVQNAIDALKPLKDEYDKLIKADKAEKETKAYDDADGNWLNRASKSSIEKYNGGECTKAQVRKAFNLFIEAKNSGKTDDAKNWANKIVTMHKNNENLFDNNFATAYKQVKSWLDDNQ